MRNARKSHMAVGGHRWAEALIEIFRRRYHREIARKARNPKTLPLNGINKTELRTLPKPRHAPTRR